MARLEEVFDQTSSWRHAEMTRREILTVAVIMVLCLAFCAAAETVQERTAGVPEVSYLGPEGTYTQEAAAFFFRDGETLIPDGMPATMAELNEELRQHPSPFRLYGA